MSKYKDLPDEQTQYILENYNKLQYKQIAENLGISKSKVYAQSKKLRENGLLPNKIKRYSWTVEEENKLISILNLSIEKISKILKKEEHHIVGKIKKLRKKGVISKDYVIQTKQYDGNFSNERKNWTKKDDDRLIENIKKMGLIRLSKLLKRTNFDTIMRYYELKEQGYQIDTYWNCKDYTFWSKEEDEFLGNCFLSSTYYEILNKIPNKTSDQIFRRANLFTGTKYVNRFKIRATSIEKMMIEILDELKVNYKFKKKINYIDEKNQKRFFISDFFIKNKNIIIEAQGDYWHGNDKVFKNLSSSQIEYKKKDKYKKEKLEELGYRVFYIWEYDLVNNLKECKEKIKEIIYS